MQPALPRSLVVVLVASACGDSGRASGDGGASESVSVTQAMPTSAPTGGSGETGSSGGSVSATGSSGAAPTTGSGPTGDPGGDPSGDPGTTGSRLDVGATGGGTVDPGTTSGEPVDLCKVQDDMNAIGECDKEAPPNSFEPEIQWAWTGPNGDQFSIVTPLVANLTDDNADGMIDLCDTPDVVVVASPSSGQPNIVGHIYVLDGLTGALHFQIPDPVDHTVTPAIGDIDGDGLPEIVTSVIGGNPVVFEHDGAKKWISASSWPEVYSGAIALADADNDGDVEILAGNRLFDHMGTLLFTAPQPAGNWSSSAFADLDGDSDLEVVLGHAAYHHDGTPRRRRDYDGRRRVVDHDGRGLRDDDRILLPAARLIDPLRAFLNPAGRAPAVPVPGRTLVIATYPDVPVPRHCQCPGTHTCVGDGATGTTST